MKSAALKITAIYMIVGAAWIAFSDRFAVAIAPTPDALAHISTAKGWAYVAATGIMLYLLVVRYTAGRQRAEDEREEAEHRLHAILDESPLGITIYRNQQMLYGNPAFARMFGYDSIEELSRARMTDLILPEVRADIVDRMRRREAGEMTPPIGDITGVRKDGTRFVLQNHTARLKLPDGPALLGFIEDVTARRELEARLLHAQKMESIGRLAGGVAHDFNNLLTVIVGYIESAETASDAAELSAALGSIRKATFRAADLTKQLLAFARRQVTEPAVVDLNVLVRDIDDMLRRIVGEDIRIDVRLSPDPCPVRVDPGHFGQVLVNLAANARDAMPDGGNLTIETAIEPMDSTDADAPAGARQVLLTVTDTGVGMSKEAQQQAFEPFYTTKEGGKGTGLGLAMCYGIVQQSGGRIWLDSGEGRGTTVAIRLPRAEGAPTPPRPTAATTRPTGTETILVVEDEEPVRQIAVAALRRYGYTTIEADSGATALELAATHDGPIDLLLTDIVMPNMGGKQLAERLTAARPSTRVLYTSGYAGDAIANHGVLDEGIALIQKPYTLDMLLQTVRQVIDGQLPEGGAVMLDTSSGR